MAHYVLAREAGKDQYIYLKEVDPVDGLIRYLIKPGKHKKFDSFEEADHYKRELLFIHPYLHFSDLEVRKMKKKVLEKPLQTWQHFQQY